MYAVGGDKPPRAKERPAWLKPAVCEDYQAGLKVQEIARKYRIANELVSEYLHQEGLLGPKPKPEPKQKPPPTPKTTGPSPALHDYECEPGETICGATYKGFKWRGICPEFEKGKSPKETEKESGEFVGDA